MSNAMQQISQINPELAQKVAMYIKETDALIHELKSERDAFQQKAASLEKNASGSPIEMAKITAVVNQVIQAGFLKQADRDKAIQAISAQPANALLSFVEKLASQRISAGAQMPKLGRAVGTETESGSAPTVRESDRVFEQRFNNFRANG
jgi:hypothetical protein